MVRAAIGAGSLLRPNSSLAGVAGSLGLASAGSGSGSSVPLSCALAVPEARQIASSKRALRRPRSRQAAPFGVFIVIMLAASNREFCRPLGGDAGSGIAPAGAPPRPRDSSRQAECVFLGPAGLFSQHAPGGTAGGRRQFGNNSARAAGY